MTALEIVAAFERAIGVLTAESDAQLEDAARAIRDWLGGLAFDDAAGLGGGWRDTVRANRRDAALAALVARFQCGDVALAAVAARFPSRRWKRPLAVWIARQVAAEVRRRARLAGQSRPRPDGVAGLIFDLVENACPTDPDSVRRLAPFDLVIERAVGNQMEHVR